MNAVFNPSAEKWDVLELLALLNGKSVQYEMGRGGLPKVVTGLDVAGALAGGCVMVEVDIRKDQFMSLMQLNAGYCDVLHSMGELKKGDLVSECGFMFVVDRVVKGDRMDRVWLKKRGRP